MNKDNFQTACDKVLTGQQGMNGIGTLSEKTVHAVLKNYLSPDELTQEIPVAGFVADIYTGREIIEIQTRNFDKLRRKLDSFLSICPVTLVYPIPHIKYLRWIHPATGEISAPRKSPKRGKPHTIFPELYKIRPFLSHPNLKLRIILMNMEEYRYLDGWSKDKKKGSTRCDRIPSALEEDIYIDSPAGYQYFLPNSLPDKFTSKDYKKATGIPLAHAQTALLLLHELGQIKRIGKLGNSFLYSIKDYCDNDK